MSFTNNILNLGGNYIQCRLGMGGVFFVDPGLPPGPESSIFSGVIRFLGKCSFGDSASPKVTSSSGFIMVSGKRGDPTIQGMWNTSFPQRFIRVSEHADIQDLGHDKIRHTHKVL